jgi:hypothetical protein
MSMRAVISLPTKESETSDKPKDGLCLSEGRIMTKESMS